MENKELQEGTYLLGPTVEGEESKWEGSFMGGGWGEPGWQPRREPEYVDAEWEDVVEESETPRDSSMEDAREMLRKKLKEEEKLRGLTSDVEEAELKSKLREYRKKYRPDVGGTVRKWLKPRPQTQLRDLYIGRAQPGLYVPKVPAWRPTTEFMPAGEAHKPELGTLRRAGAPGPSQRIKTPFRDVQRFEGLGTAMGRLRQLEQFPAVDRAVYAEIHANGDIDTPSHVRREVSQLGFTKKEIDTSLKRLRSIGMIAPSGNGKELMVT